MHLHFHPRGRGGQCHPLYEALHLGYAVTPVNLTELSTVRNCTVGIQNPDAAGVAALTADPMIFVIRDLPLIEPAGLRTHYARTNILLRSEQMGVAFQPPWVPTRASITDDDIAAPDGVVDADKLVEDNTAAATHLIGQDITWLNSTQYAMSAFVRADERDRGRLRVPGWAVSPYVDFDLGAETVAGTNTDAVGLEDWGNGYFRVWMVATSGLADAGASRFNIHLSDAAGAVSYNGDNTSGFHVWGAQVEAGHAPSPYIETGAASASSVVPVYYSTRPRLLYQASRDALMFETIVSCPYAFPDEVTHPLFEIWEDANNYIRLYWNPRAAGDRWNLRTNTGGVATAQNQNSTWPATVGTKYLLRLIGAAITGGAAQAWTLDVYSCDAVGRPTALVETITFTNAVTYPGLAANRVYLGSTSAGTGQTDLHIWEVVD